MTERRPHWDDDLIEAVNDAMENNAYHDEMVYAVIVAVEDWVYDNFQGRGRGRRLATMARR